MCGKFGKASENDRTQDSSKNKIKITKMSHYYDLQQVLVGEGDNDRIQFF